MIFFLIVSVLLQPPVPTFEPLASPTPIATVEPVNLGGTLEVPESEVYNYLATANANVQSVPQDLSDPGIAVLPAENGGELFGYAKWVTSGAAAAEVFGPFSLIVTHLGAAITLVIFLAIVYVAIFLATLIIRFVTWIIRKIRTVGA